MIETKRNIYRHSTLYLWCLMLFICFLFPLSVLSEDYKLGTGDVVKITVYDHADLTTQIRIDGKGMIHLPLVGNVYIEGLTAAEAAGKITDLLADGFIVGPQVTLTIVNYESKKAVILGEVAKPGLYEIKEKMTLLELISSAGGLQKDAGHIAVVKRNSPFLDIADKTVIHVNLKALIEKGQSSLNIPIFEGDSVYIGKSQSFFITGQIEKPGEYTFDNPITVIKAISISGGLTNKASTSNIRIIRKIEDKETTLSKVSMDEPILPDDVIIIPESFF